MRRPGKRAADLTTDHEADVVLIGGGIMSTTLGAMLAVVQPDWRILLVERADTLASESSGPWNNAGTGHMGLCELNYMPDPADGRTPARIARQFHLTRQWWAFLAMSGLVDPARFVHATPHMDVVFGADDVAYLRERHRTLVGDPLFAELRYSEEPGEIAEWAPLVMRGRSSDEPIAATWHPGGTDVDFGALTTATADIIADNGGEILLRHEVRSLTRTPDGGWIVSGRRTDDADGHSGRFTIHARRHVFVGAGGLALRLLQRAGLPEVRGYAVLPVGAAFFRCSTPSVVAAHTAKVYGQAAVGAPPMSVPHLDARVVDGRRHLLFGPYATFSTRLLKSGSLTDAFTTLRWRNLPVIAAAMWHNLALIRFLIVQLLATRSRKFEQLRRFLPTAVDGDWELIPAGQRAQLVVPDESAVGAIHQGTELVTSADRSISGVLGASPGASTAVTIMVDVLRTAFPDRWTTGWEHRIGEAIPDLDRSDWTDDAVRRSFTDTSTALGLPTEF
ncbi:malate:quinone oxidoreductase [Gordonia soli]|uniref:Probable malate:quinone oxidoreductase n=1 Tax=Gordonia soli NBRC 108243 TaxID=1223545 RepID=M0QDD6_9ACTN|nr:malate:quinone oxidoreductase [Gordonia soli]GAC66623.1 putative malate--quinone oxidoreductase [Gordonia soli NBRC 108243]